MNIQTVHVESPEGQNCLTRLKNRFVVADSRCRDTVTEILQRVRSQGDIAVVDYTRRFDSPKISLDTLLVSEDEFSQAYQAIDPELYASLQMAAGRIRSFHEREMEDSWMLTRDDGAVTGRLVRPVDSAGLYVPGGQGGSTPLVSSVLMNGIPAAIAGVKRQVMVTPADKEGKVNPALLVAAREVGIHEVYKIGSAWAIAALAFGTPTIDRVDVIVGPGNQYVTEAKRQVMGMVRIDMIAGPSEVLIVADNTAKAAYIAADMLAQAEHDTEATAILLTTEEGIAQQVAMELERQSVSLSRQQIARKSIDNNGLILIATSLDSAIELANDIAAEHLELQIDSPWEWLPKIRHAGAVFLGNYTPEAAGDYVAGPNHVLPTMGTARISSALGVETFLKKSSIIAYTRQALLNDAVHIQRLASLEGLTAHGNSVVERIKGE